MNGSLTVYKRISSCTQPTVLTILILINTLLLFLSAPQIFAETKVDALMKELEPQIDAWGDYVVGLSYLNGTLEKTDYQKAAQMFRKSAEKGLPHGQCQMGRMYNSGLGVPQDSKEAMLWFLRAAEQGHTECQFLIAVMYEEGQGISKDRQQALRWYRSAAENGYPTAQLKLGLCFLQGESVPQDYVQAHMWLNLASSQNIKAAGDLRDTLAPQMTQDQVAEAQRLARDWAANHIKRP